MEIRSPRNESELTAVFELCAAAFPGVPREYFVRSVRNDPDWQPWQTRILLEGGVVVSTVQVFHREVAFAGRWVPCAGIGNVATHPAFRHRGYASALMRDCLQLCRQKGYALSLLFTGIPRFYRRFGYRTLPTVRNWLASEGSAKTEPRVREVCAGDWASVRALHEMDGVGRPVVVRRDLRRWELLDRSAISNCPRWLVHGGPIGVEGYLRLDVLDGQWTITEYVAPDAHTLSAMVQEALRQSGERELVVDSLDPGGMLSGTGLLKRRIRIEELMIAIVDEEALVDAAGFSSAHDLDGYIEFLAKTGVDMWRTDFF
jgi:predicted N-acetyltransferase YhbS